MVVIIAMTALFGLGLALLNSIRPTSWHVTHTVVTPDLGILPLASPEIDDLPALPGMTDARMQRRFLNWDVIIEWIWERCAVDDFVALCDCAVGLGFDLNSAQCDFIVGTVMASLDS